VVLHPISAGTAIEARDLGYQSVVLGTSAGAYLPATTNPIGSITRRRLAAGSCWKGVRSLKIPSFSHINKFRSAFDR
jgi:hypothetical protein